MSVLKEIEAERSHQIAKGYDAAHDDEHPNGEIAMAAASFAANDPRLYPWGPLPIHDGGRRETLIKASALLVAEIERLDRVPAFTESYSLPGHDETTANLNSLSIRRSEAQ